MEENQFLTKTGTCTVTDKEIIITRDGPKGGLATAIFGETIARTMGMYLAVAVLLMGNAIFAFNEGSYLLGAVLATAAVLLARGMIKNRNASAVRTILLSEITQVQPFPPLTGFRGYFVVHFERNGKEMRRFIILPGAARDGKKEYKKAEKIMSGIQY